MRFLLQILLSLLLIVCSQPAKAEKNSVQLQSPSRSSERIGSSQPSAVTSNGAAVDESVLTFFDNGQHFASPDLAIGPDHVLATSSQGIAVYRKNDLALLDTKPLTGPGGLFPELPASARAIDPQAIYNPLSARFIVSSVTRTPDGATGFSYAVSAEGNPLADFYTRPNFTGGFNHLSTGIWQDGVYFLMDSSIALAPLDHLLDPNRHHFFGGGLGGGIKSAAKISGRDDQRAFFAHNLSGDIDQVRIATTPTDEFDYRGYSPSVPWKIRPEHLPLVEQPSGGAPISLSRSVYINGEETVENLATEFQTVSVAGERLYTAHTNAIDGFATIRWYEVVLNGFPNPGLVPEVNQYGELSLSSQELHAFNPMITSDAAGNLLLTFNVAGQNQAVSVMRSVRAHDAPEHRSVNTSGFSGPVMLAEGNGTLDGVLVVEDNLIQEFAFFGANGDVQADPYEPGVFYSHMTYVTADNTWATQLTKTTLSTDEPANPYDLNGDGVVDTADLGLLINAFGSTNSNADLNGDGVVDTADLGTLINEMN